MGQKYNPTLVFIGLGKFHHKWLTFPEGNKALSSVPPKQCLFYCSLRSRSTIFSLRLDGAVNLASKLEKMCSNEQYGYSIQNHYENTPM